MSSVIGSILGRLTDKVINDLLNKAAKIIVSKGLIEGQKIYAKVQQKRAAMRVVQDVGSISTIQADVVSGEVVDVGDSGSSVGEVGISDAEIESIPQEETVPVAVAALPPRKKNKQT
jgi:hypothetical protein